jgi:hypothetical protein
MAANGQIQLTWLMPAQTTRQHTNPCNRYDPRRAPETDYFGRLGTTDAAAANGASVGDSISSTSS